MDGRERAGAAGGGVEQPGKRALFGWVMFDWASQPFYTLVVTFLFAPYFVNGFMAGPARGAKRAASETFTISPRAPGGAPSCAHFR